MTNELGTMPGSGQNNSGPAISAQEFQNLVEMVGADMPEVLVDLLDTYIEESAGLVAAIGEAFQRRDVPSMLRPAHSLKSSSASIGAMQLSHLCHTLEAYARGSSPAIDVPTTVASIQHEFGRVRSELTAARARFAGG